MSRTPSVTRMPMLSQEAARQAAIAVGVPEVFASLNVFRVLLHQPGVAKQIAELLSELLAGKALDPRQRELIIMRLGWSTHSVYEWTQHWRVARSMGMTEVDILGVRDWHNHSAYSSADRCVLAAVDDWVADGAIQAETWSRCEAEFADPAVRIELVAAIGTWCMISALLRSLDVPLEDGVAAWPPDGRAPSSLPDPVVAKKP